MPTYAYECPNGHPYEERRSMSDDQQRTICPKPDCAQPLRRVYDAVPISFKGKGFYSSRG
jgi:putative FmdB family regulatory protein